MSKERTCSIEGCNEPAIRSFARTKVTEALKGEQVSLDSDRSKRVFLCKQHYRMYKRLTKKDKKIDKWRYGA